MNYRTLGKTGWQVSEVGYGMWGMGAWTGSDDETSRRALQRAVDRGCNFFDTAWAYGEGKSEVLLGELVRANPGFRLYTATKVPPKNRKWPSEVEIPVGEKGKRLFFLGNVHGWASHDPGTGPWGAVAEYVIHYADGKTQTAPLITGRTADEWALPPEASEVFAGLKGQPWHLNVLGVKLRPTPVKKIIFRDLGTPAAPVLAGVTLEK